MPLYRSQHLKGASPSCSRNGSYGCPRRKWRFLAPVRKVTRSSSAGGQSKSNPQWRRNERYPPFPSAEERAQIRLAYGASVGDFLLVMPARFIPGKGHATLLEALGLLKREKSWIPKLFACGAVLMALR